MKRILLASTLLLAAPALAAHTRSSDPVALSGGPHTYITCSGQDATAAITAGLVPGGTVLLGAGTCYVSAHIPMASASVLTGPAPPPWSQGLPAAVLKAATPGTYNVVDFGAASPAPGVTGATLENVVIDGSAVMGNPRNGGAVGEGIMIWGNSTNNTVLNVLVHDAAENDIRVGGSYNTIIHSIFTHAYHNGVFFQGTVVGTTAHWAHGNHITNSAVTYNSLAQAPGCKFKGLCTEPSWDGIDVGQEADATLIQGNVVNGNDILGNQFDGRFPADGNQAIGNTVENTLDGGVHFDSHETNALIQGNTVINAWPHSLGMSAGATGIITGNTVVSAPTGYPPIVGGPGVTITENTLR